MPTMYVKFCNSSSCLLDDVDSKDVLKAVNDGNTENVILKHFGKDCEEGSECKYIIHIKSETGC